MTDKQPPKSEKAKQKILFKPVLPLNRKILYITLFFSLIAIITAGFLAAFSGVLLDNLQVLQKNKSAETAHLETFAKQMQTNNEQMQQLRSEWQQVQQHLKQQQQRLRQLAPGQAIVAEALQAETAHLLRLAQFYSQQGNAKAAIELLQSVKPMVEQMAESGLQPVKQAIETDQEQLIQWESQYEQQWQQLAQIRQQIQSLSWSAQQFVKQKPAQQAAQDEQLQSVWQRAVHSLRQIVVIRRHDTAANPVLTESEFLLWQQRLLLYLDQMQLAMQQQDAKVYHQLWNQLRHSLQTHRLTDNKQQIAGIQDSMTTIHELPEKVQLTALNEFKQWQQHAQ